MDTSRNWYYALDDSTRYGPLSLDELIQLAKERKIKSTTRVWHPDFPDWSHASKITGLSNHVATEPPPLSQYSDQVTTANISDKVPFAVKKKRFSRGLATWLIIPMIVGIAIQLTSFEIRRNRAKSNATVSLNGNGSALTAQYRADPGVSDNSKVARGFFDEYFDPKTPPQKSQPVEPDTTPISAAELQEVAKIANEDGPFALSDFMQFMYMDVGPGMQLNIYNKLTKSYLDDALNSSTIVGMKRDHLRGLCASKKDLIDRGVTVNSVLFDTSGKEIYSISVSQRACVHSNGMKPSEQSETPTLAALEEFAAERMKTLPTALDDVTEWTAVSAAPSTLIYQYKITDQATSDALTVEMFDTLKNNTLAWGCSGNLPLISHGIAYRISYTDYYARPLGDILVSLDKCPAAR